MHEYLNLFNSKIKQNENGLSLQGLKVHKNWAQVYEQFNWIVWAVSHYYFENHLFDRTNYGLPPVENDAWIDGFMWKDVYFRLVPMLQASLIKQEIEALKHITLELEECFWLEEKYKSRFKVDTSQSYHKKIIPPLISITECGSYAIYGSPLIPILKTGSSNPNNWIKNLQSSMEIDLSDSMLQLMPCLNNLSASNLVPLNLKDFEDKLVIVNAFKAMSPFQPDAYSKCIIRIPQENSEEITIYPYPNNGKIPLTNLISLFQEGKTEDKDTPRKHESLKQERSNIKECNFYFSGSKIKILLYDSAKSQNHDNERARAVFMSRDERVWNMASLKNYPPTKEFISNFLTEHTMIGEPEEVSGDVLLVVEQNIHSFKLPYWLLYNKPVRKPELYIERTINRAREVLETTNDIVNDIALTEFLQRKGIWKSAVWILAALVKTKLIKQLWMSIILAEAIKRLIDKEIFIQSSILGKEKIPAGLVLDDKDNTHAYKQALLRLIEIIVTKKFEAETKTFKNLLMVLFFYRLESMQFHNSLQFEVGTKDYYQGKFILDDVLQVPSENPLLFLKVVQNTWKIKFSFELLRQVGVDKYCFVYNDKPFSICQDQEDGEKLIQPMLYNHAPVNIRERMYFLMAKLISTNEYKDTVKEFSESEEGDSLNSKYSSHGNNTVQSLNIEDEEDDEDEAEDSYNSYESREKELSPPFKQAKFDRTDSKALFNNLYSSRNSLSSNYDNVLRASHSNMNLNKNFIDSKNHDKKIKYIWK